jgi:hypothetical protein
MAEYDWSLTTTVTLEMYSMFKEKNNTDKLAKIDYRRVAYDVVRRKDIDFFKILFCDERINAFTKIYRSINDLFYNMDSLLEVILSHRRHDMLEYLLKYDEKIIIHPTNMRFFYNSNARFVLFIIEDEDIQACELFYDRFGLAFFNCLYYQGGYITFTQLAVQLTRSTTLLKWLLDKGIDVNRVLQDDTIQQSPLAIACRRASMDHICAILNHTDGYISDPDLLLKTKMRLAIRNFILAVVKGYHNRQLTLKQRCWAVCAVHNLDTTGKMPYYVIEEMNSWLIHTDNRHPLIKSAQRKRAPRGKKRPDPQQPTLDRFLKSVRRT